MVVQKFMMRKLALPRINKIIDLENSIAQRDTVVKAAKSSPERFEIVHELIDLPSNHITLPDFPRTIPSLTSSIKHIRRSLTSLDQNPDNPKTVIDEQLRHQLEEYATSMGIGAIGYTKLPPHLIFQNKAVLYNNAIVLAWEMDKEKIEIAPYSQTARMIMRTYDELGKATNKISTFLRDYGFSTHASHPLGGVTLYPPLAEFAGLGWHGISGLLITPEYGPRVRLFFLSEDA